MGGRTIGHVAVVGGLALPVIAEVASLSQAGSFKWNFLSVLALVLLVFYFAYSIGYVIRHRERPVPVPESFPPNSVIARKLVNKESGKMIGVNVFTDETENEGLIAKDYPPPPPPVLDLTDSHDVSFGGFTFEGSGTVIKSANSYNISFQNGKAVQRDEEEGETPIV